MYSRRDDLVDDSAVDDDHISEHLQVTALIDSWSASHVENYSLAAYRYLRLNRGTSLGEIDSGDFAEVVNTSTLEFIEVASAIVTGNWLGPGNDANNLSSLFQSVLNPISCDEHCLFYEKSAINPFLEDEFNLLLDDEDAEESVDSGSEGEGSLASIGSDEIKSSTASSFLELDHPRHVDAPIFAQILIDGRLATSDDLNNIQNSTKLATRLSVFKGHGSTRPLQSSHQAAASDLKRLLNAYSAEQTLERLRHRGLSLQESDVRLAMSCLRKARNGERVVVHVSFYVAKVDAMVAASSHVGAVIEIDEAFSLLGSEFRNSSNLPLRQLYSPDNFLLEKLDMSYASLDCFCFVKVHRVEGVVTVDMNHLGGWEKSSMLMDLVCDEISLCVHKVNQFLLLQALHSGRSASRLLISSDLKDSVDTFNRAVVNPFHEGVFFCPIVYKNSFELYHRCAAHPIHVIRLLEASVLHIFSVNNRRGVFVYKDESGAVFYMSLLPVQSDVGESTSVDHSAQIELVVHGISAPGPSIALQLRTLLQKRLLHISIEMFSSVLTKNPQYHWRQLDINFVRSFNNEWDKLIESDNIPRHINESRKYAFPLSAYDPGMITLFFRQNLCGSTFFHPLSTAESGKEANDCDDDNSNQKDTGNLHFDSSDLVFYYNASPSTLDPDFQSESTLTEKGALYSREAGAGIAIVTISLVCNAGKRKHDVSAAIPPPNVARALIVPTEKLRFLNANEATFLDQSDDDSDSFVEVTICDTCLQCATLHEWILLSMTQALVAWVLERHLERMQLSMFAVEGAGSSRTTNTTSTEQSRLREIDDICCGLPALHSILETSHQLPHPAVLKREYGGVFRSSSVAHIALDLLEKGIIDQIRNESKVQLVKDKHYRLFIVRSSRSEKPGLVELERATDGSVRVRCSQVKGGVEFLQDSPIDCPEYTILLFSSDFADDTSFVTKKTFPKLFEEVSVGYANSGVKGNYAKSLFRFKRQHLRFFRRSFAFIFTVKRNRRCLLAYNWSTSLFNRTTLKLQELERSFLISMSDSVASFQQRCLGNLSPTLLATNREKISGSGKDKEIRVWSEGPVTAGQGDRLDLNQPQSSQSSTHPHLMRRPKLVGKSVEGSAAQAVARSRARASVSRFRSTSSNSSAVAPRPPSGAHKSVRSPSPNIAVRKTSELPLPLQASSIDATEDRTLTNVRRYVDMIEQRTRLTHQSSVRAHTSLMLAAAHWPSKLSRGVSISVAQYLTSYGVFVWSEVYPMLPYPKKQLGSFSLTLGQTLSTLTPGLVPIPMIGQCAGDSCILAGKPRIIRNCQAFVVVNLSAKECFVNEKPVIIVKSEGRVLTLPLRRKKCHDKKCQSMNEYIAAAFDKLASDLRALVRLQSKLFDHSASLIEWTMKSGKTEDFGEVHWILTRLIESYPRITITKALRSNYKVR